MAGLKSPSRSSSSISESPSSSSKSPGPPSSMSFLSVFLFGLVCSFLGAPFLQQTFELVDLVKWEVYKVHTLARLPGREVGEPKGIERARALLKVYPLIDTHNDLAFFLRDQFHNHINDIDLNREDFPGQCDIPKLRKGNNGGLFWSVYVPCSSHIGLEEGEDFSNATWRVRDTLEQIDLTKELISKHSDTFEYVTTAKEAKKAFRKGKIASFMGIEGAHQLGNSLGVLRMMYSLGVRYVTLTHTCHNGFADSSGFFKGMIRPKWGGLSELGKVAIKEMNRIGMVIDISHTSPTTASQVLSLSLAPPIYSHSNGRGVWDHPRHVPDSTLRRLGRYSSYRDNNNNLKSNSKFASSSFPSSSSSPPLLPPIDQTISLANDSKEEFDLNNPLPLPLPYEGNDWGIGEEEKREVKSGDGIVLVNFAAILVSEVPSIATEEEKKLARRANIGIMADHVEHIAKLAGPDKVGIGADYYGTGTMPEGLEDVSKYPYLLAELICRGWTDDEIAGLAGGNLLRVLSKVETVAAKLKKEGAKVETMISENRRDFDLNLEEQIVGNILNGVI